MTTTTTEEETTDRGNDQSPIANSQFSAAGEVHRLKGRLHFRYTDFEKVLHSVCVGSAEWLHVVGDPNHGAYEFVLIAGAITHSDCGYGDSTIALRDGLIAFHGFPNAISQNVDREVAACPKGMAV